ncbi:MAG: hypothetical protein WCW33_01140 [Candidatus Babeliales bacterium]|jgi:hypothetical protein
MNMRAEQSRITIDLPKSSHRKLKAMAAILGKSMREIIIESIDEHLYKQPSPNKKTLKAIKDTEKRKGLVEAQSVNDLFKKLGI